MTSTLPMSIAVALASLVVTTTVEAQLTRRIVDRVKTKVQERKLQTEDSLVARAAEPADSVLVRVTAPVESTASRLAGGAAGAVGSIGRGGSGTAAEAARLREQLAAGRAELEQVRFAPGEPTLDPSSDASLQALAMALADSPGVFLVRARPDAEATGLDAGSLGEARAASVKAWLLANGVPGDRVFATGDVASTPGVALVSVTPMQ